MAHHLLPQWHPIRHHNGTPSATTMSVSPRYLSRGGRELQPAAGLHHAHTHLPPQSAISHSWTLSVHATSSGSSVRGHSRRGRCTRRPTPKESTQQNHPHVTVTSLTSPAPLPHISSHTHLPAPGPSPYRPCGLRTTRGLPSRSLLRGGVPGCPLNQLCTPPCL